MQSDEQPKGSLASGAYSIGPSRAIAQKYIDAGEIEAKDIELMNRAYINMSTMSFIGSTVLGAGSYFFMKKKAPHWGIGRRLMTAGGLGMVGSFIGWTVGGVGVALDLNGKMTDPKRKLAVMAQISEETRQAIIEARRTGQPLPTYTPPSGQTWDAPADRERRAEMDRERGLQKEIGQGENEMDRSATGIASAVKNDTLDTWDRIRLERPAPTPQRASVPSQQKNAPTPDQEDTRSQEQKEFDALLEKERQGVDTNDTWK